MTCRAPWSYKTPEGRATRSRSDTMTSYPWRRAVQLWRRASCKKDQTVKFSKLVYFVLNFQKCQIDQFLGGFTRSPVACGLVGSTGRKPLRELRGVRGSRRQNGKSSSSTSRPTRARGARSVSVSTRAPSFRAQHIATQRVSLLLSRPSHNHRAVRPDPVNKTQPH
jgi:hypothetical protein